MNINNREFDRIRMILQTQCTSVLSLQGSGIQRMSDRDKDGVEDKLDQCRDVVGKIEYDGCPVADTDKDGILDDADKCVNVPGVLAFRNNQASGGMIYLLFTYVGLLCKLMQATLATPYG